jgi:hypothetical protein
MDRELIVKKDGYVLGQILFKYKTQTSGDASILINKIVDVEHGLKAVYPLYKHEIDFSHEELVSIEEIKTFDKDFFYERPDPEDQFGGDIEFTYPAIHYRYSGAPGIADIRADFLANKKDLRFISVSRIKNDHSLQANRLETNVTLLGRLCALPTLNCPDAAFSMVDYKQE